MAQTIPTPNSDAQIASQPIDPGLFPGLDEAFGLSGEANLDFSDLDKLDISSKLTDSEKGIEDPFAKLPRANPKDFVDTAGKDWQIGQEGVDIDMAAADIRRQVFSTNQPADLTELKARQKALAKSQYYNQADNLASRALHGTVQMLPPMVGGQLAGVEKGVERGMQMGLVGSAGFLAGPEVGAPMVGAFTGLGVAGGNLEGSFNYWTKQGEGASFLELVDAGVNQVTAANISQFVGPVYAAIEYAQVGRLIDTVGGKELKRGILRGAMRQLAKVVPAGAKVAAEKVAQVSARPLVRGGLNVAGNIVEQSAEEAAQGGVMQAATEYGKSQQQLIAQGARDGAMEVLANLDLPEASKQILSRGFDDFASSIGPMAVLSGGAKGISLTSKASWDGFKTLASGDLNKAAAQREAIAKAGAPLTAQAVAEDAVAGRPSATPTAETVTPTAPVVAPVDEPALDAELEAAGKAPEEALQPEAAKPSAGLPGDELGAKIFSSIRSRKPIAKADLDQVGGFSLSADWKLNEETGNYEYQGKVYEGKEAPKVSAAEAEVAPITKPEAKAPKAQAVAPIESAKPEVLGQVTEAIAPAITPAKPDRETQVAEAWLAGVNQATTEKERKSRIRIISEKANSLSKSERKSVSIFKKMLQPEQLGVTPEAPKVEASTPGYQAPYRIRVTPDANGTWSFRWEHERFGLNEEGIIQQTVSSVQSGFSTAEEALRVAEEERQASMRNQIAQAEKVATALEERNNKEKGDARQARKQRRSAEENKKLYEEDYPTAQAIATTVAKQKVEAIAKEPALPKWEEVQKNKNKMSFLKGTFKKANAKLTKEQQVVPKVGWKKNDFYSALERMYGLITQLEFKQPDDVAPLAPKVAEAPKPTELSESEKRRKFKLQNIFKIFNNSNLDGDQILFRDLAMKNVRQIASQMASQFNNLIDPDGEIYSRSVEAIALRLNTSFLQKTPVFFNKDGKALDITEEAVQTWLRKVADRAGLDAARQQSAKREVFTEFGGKPAEGAITQPSAAKEEDKPTGMQVPIVKSEEVDEPRATVSVREAAAEVRKQSSPEEKLVLDWVVAQLIRENPVADMVINFGKYKGSTLQDIAKTKEGREYLQWLASQELKPGRDGKPFKGDIERNNIIKRLLINSPDPETLRGLRTYLALAEYLSKVAKRTISAKRVGATVDSVVRKLANALTDVGIKVTGEDIMVALSPEGQQAKERFVAEEARAKAARDERTAKANLSDRARNLRSGYAVKQRIVDAIASATLENRARIQNEVIALAEEDLLEDADINNRLDNIEKGLQNEKPAIGQPIPRRGRRGTEQTKESKVRNRVAEPSENAGGTTGTGATATGQPTDGARRVEPVGARPSGNGQQVGGKQQTATGNVSVDVNLSGSAAKVLAQAAVSNGVPAILQDNPRGASVVAVNFNQVEGQEVPIILVNQKLLAKVRRDIMANYPKDGKTVFAEWAWRAVNQEIIHFRHLKLLERLAKEDGIDYKAYLKKEAKRLIQYIKRKRGLRKKIEAIYNNGEKMGDFELAFEFTRMLVEEKMLGSITESATFDVGKMLASLDSEGRGFIFRFMELVRDLMYGLTGRTEAETRFLRATADAIISEQRKIMRNLYSPNEKLPVGLNFYKPKEKVIVGTAADQKASEEEIRKDTGLNRASMEFLREYARELGIQEPMIKVKKPIKDEKTGKVVERKISFPAWKKPDYVKAIKEKLKELGKKPKELGAAMPMRFKTEYAFQQIDRAVATKKGIFKGLTIANDNTLPWENLKARILNNRFKGKGVSKAEANWVLPTLEALVRNGRVDADQAVAAIKALANSKVEVDYLRSPERPPKEAIQAGFSVKKADLERRLSVRYSEINPKPVREMQNLREILVRAPGVTTFRGHYPGKDVLGFGRMYSTLQGGKNGTFLFEVQSDARDERFSQDNDRDPDSFIFKVSATEKNLLEAFAPEFGNTLTVSTENYNPFNREDIIPEGYRDDLGRRLNRVLRGDILSGGVEEPPEIVARKVGENLYHVFGIFAVDLNRLIETNGGGLAEITEDITPVSPPNIQQAIKRKEELEKNKSLLDAYESLVLKAAIADAIANGEDFIAITDAETAAMTEGHREVKQGMRVHYGTANGSLHNLAKKLTGDIGTPFNDGPSSYVYDQEQADQTETPPAVNRYPKKDVTGVSYSLEKLKAQGEDSDVQNILGAAMPMRFKTEYAFQQIDRSFGSKRGIFKGLTVDNNNTLPWENLKAKIIKGTSKAEANWVLPTLEALVRNGRVDVDQAVAAIKALAKSKIIIKEITDSSKESITNLPPEVQAAIKYQRTRNQIIHEIESQLSEVEGALTLMENFIDLDAYDIFQEDKNVKVALYEYATRAEIEELGKDFELKATKVEVQKLQEFKGKLADAYASFAKELFAAGANYSNNFDASQTKAITKALYIANNLRDGEEQQKAFAKIGFYIAGSVDLSEVDEDPRASARFERVNPKPFKDMQDLREILIKTPIGDIDKPNIHYPDDMDIVGFGRMYTTKQGDKTGTFLFEAQTDAASTLEEVVGGFGGGGLADYLLPGLVFLAPNREDLKEALQDIVPQGMTVILERSGNKDKFVYYIGAFGSSILDQSLKQKRNLAIHRGGDQFRLVGEFGFQLLKKVEKDPKLAEKLKLNLNDQQTKDFYEQSSRLRETAPLVDAYESLVLKGAISNAIERGHDFIAITDDETAAMTEGHSKVNDGMRAHYGVRNGSLHNLARKLTGDTGTPFNDGASTYGLEFEEANRIDDNMLRITRTAQLSRYQKEEVTGVSYSLENLKAQAEDSSLQDILGAAMPTDRPYWLKPDGEILEVDDNPIVDWNSVGGHADAAIEFLKENDPSNTFLVEWGFMDPLKRKERQQSPIQEMINMGWLRVVGDGFNLYFEGDPNKTQLDKLFEAAIEDEVKLIQDQSGITGRPKSNVWYEPPVEDELGAAMPRLGFSTTEPRFRRAWKELPESLEGLTEFRRIPSGTHDVRLYQDSMGDLFAVKRGQTQEQFENEIAAENVYRIMNYPVPRSRLVKDENGNTAKIASWVDGPTLKEFKKIKIGEDKYEDVEEVYRQIGDGMLIDAFLFNYDVLGLDLDNIVVAHDLVPEEDGVTLPEPEVYYTPYRVDNGGTFDTRARGGLKDAFFYDSFQDLTTKYPEIDVTASDVVAQIGDLVLNSDAILNVIPKRLRPMMAQRLQWMADQLSAADIMPPAAGRTEQQVEEHFKRLSTQLAQVEVTRNEQGELINPITGIPSRIYLLDPKGKVIGFTPKSEFRYRLERTPVFKMWFGDWENAPEADGTSKILDQAGEPWVLYHGTSYSKRSDKLRIDEAQQNAEELKRYPRRFSTANLFRGTWTSTSRQFAEDWANDVYGGEYDENVVIPVYVKSTNTFDPRNKEHTKMLVSYLKDKMSFDPYTRKLEVALEFDFYDWTYFEPQTYDIPNTAEERTLKGKYFKRYPYNLLESIVNMGFDGIWVREKALGTPGKLETSPKNLVEELEIIRRTEDKTYEERTTQTLKEDIAAYNENSTWNHLSFRSDGVKSAMNTGKFSTKKQKAFEVFPESARLLNQVTKNNKTGWNEFEKGGKTYASYDKPEKLVTYAFSDSASLSRANVAKTTFKKSGVVFFARRTTQDVRSAGGRESTDILGAAMPRRFGVRIKDKMEADAYDKLKNLTYEPIPDSMVQEEAEAYLERHGIRGAMEATISKSSPLEHGSRELLAQIIILKLNEQYNKTKDARILEDLIDYTDTFLSISSEAGRALRQLSFWSKLTPEGMLMLYKKKLDEVNRETRDRFNEFFAKVKRELSTLPAGALDQALKNMEGLLGKADKAAEESRKKLATSNTMTFWENFSKQIGDSLVQKAQEQLNAAEEELARTAGGEGASEGQTAMAKVNNAKTINQAAQEMSRNIKQMFMNLANEQKKNIRDPRVITDEEFANKTDEELAKIQKEERDAKQANNFTDMLSRWPKALQAWTTASNAIRAQAALNPDMADMFQNFLDLVLKTPFTMPQMKRFLSLKGVKLEQLVEEHYQEGKLSNNAYDLARKMVEEAGLGAWEEETGTADYSPGGTGTRSTGVLVDGEVKPTGIEKRDFVELEKREEGMAKAEPSKRVATLSMSQRLTQALANQIMEYARAETEKKLNRLVESYADKRLEPSLKRFIKRIVQYQALGLFSNAYAWNEFQKQEGLDKLKPEVVKQLLEFMEESRSLTGFRKEEKYADALSLIAYETNTGLWNFTKAWWYLSILSGLTTQAANLIGNTYNTLLLTIPTIGKHIVSGAVNPARSRAIVKQMFRAMSLSLQDLGYVLTTGRIGTRKSDNPFFSQASTDYFEVIARNSPNMASRISARTAAMIRRAMTGVDMMFYNFNKEVYLFDSAYNQAKESGLSGSEATAKALDLTFRSSGELQNALNLAISEGYVVDGEPLGFFKALSKIESPKTKIERAKQKIEQSIRIQEIIDANVSGNVESSRVAIGAQVYGEELTYNEEPKGFLGAIHRAVSELSVKYGIVSVPIPFTKIVANVWNQGLDAMGFGLFRSGKLVHGKLAKAFPPLKMLERFEMKGLKGTADEVQARKDMSFVRSFNAAIAVGIVFLLDLAFCGQYENYGFEFCINGPGPKEPAQKELLKNRLKWKPNSVFFRTSGINGVYLSYMLSPLAIPMAAIGLYKDNEIYNYYSKKSPKDASLAMAHRLLTVPMEMNFLSGLADMFEILSPSNPETALAKTKSFLSRMGSAMLVPNFFRDVDQLLVSSLPGVLNPRTARENIIQAAFISNTPIIRQMYGSAELDILGQPIEMTSRVLSFAEKDALVDVLIQKNALPTAPKKDKLLGLVPMDDEQYARFREYRAKQLGADLNKPEMIEALSKLEPAMAQLYVQKYTQKANALAKAKLLREDPEILGEAREAKSKQFK